VEESKPPVLKKNATDYEIGEYYKAKERWDMAQEVKKTPAKKIKTEKEELADKLLEKYNNLQKEDDQTDDSFMKMMKIEDRYRELTGEEIALKSIEMTMDDASSDRFYSDDFESTDDVLWSKSRKPSRVRDA
jgi:hypothetical protein